MQPEVLWLSGNTSLGVSLYTKWVHCTETDWFARDSCGFSTTSLRCGTAAC